MAKKVTPPRKEGEKKVARKVAPRKTVVKAKTEPKTEKKVVEKKIVKVLPTAEERAIQAAQIIADNKGTDIEILDLREVTQAFDYFVIGSGASRRQLHAISDEIDDVFEKKIGDRRRGVCGYQDSRWIVLDYDDVVIHLFDPEMREFYAIEELWGKGKVLPISLSKAPN